MVSGRGAAATDRFESHQQFLMAYIDQRVNICYLYTYNCTQSDALLKGDNMKKTGIIKAMMLCKAYERMSEKDRNAVRLQRLNGIVEHARSNSPFYRKLYENVPESFSLRDLPPTDKRVLMENWNEWVCDGDITLAEAEAFMTDLDNIGCKIKGKYLVLTTSGSTGNPLVALYDATANNIMGGIAACRSYARKEDLRAFLKHGKKSIGIFADGGFYLGNSSIRSRLRSMPWKKKQLAVSSALYPIPEIVEQLNRFQPAMLGGYPSHLELLIEEAQEGRLQIAPVIIMTGGEYLSDKLRKRLSETFHCYVQTSYSCTEGGTVACECTSQHFHINDDWVIVEPVDAEGNPVPDGVRSDKIYLTNLYNYTQPYIRYQVSDRVIMHHEPCGCGKTTPWIELEGRSDDVTVFREDDREVRVAPLALYAVLKEVEGIRRFQVRVYSGNTVELRIEEKNGACKAEVFEKAKESLINYLRTQNVRTANVIFSEDLPQQDPGSGKFKHIIRAE